MNPIMSMLRSKNNPSNQSSLPFDSKSVKKMSFPQFVKMMQGKDAKSIVDQLCASGQMSEEQKQTLLKEAKTYISNGEKPFR